MRRVRRTPSVATAQSSSNGREEPFRQRQICAVWQPSHPGSAADCAGEPARACGDRSPGTNESGEVLYEKAEVLKKVDFRPSLLAADDLFYTKFKKRTIYLPVVRNVLPDVLALFDAADPNGVTAVRRVTSASLSRLSWRPSFSSPKLSSASRRPGPWSSFSFPWW